MGSSSKAGQSDEGGPVAQPALTTSRIVACTAAILLVLAIPSIRPILVLTDSYGLFCLYLSVYALTLVFWLRSLRLRALIEGRSGRGVVIALMLGFVGFCALFYQWASTLEVGNSTGDDAVIQPFRAWLSGHSMYGERLFDGAPISPGPLWVLQNGWLSTLGAHFLLTPVYLGATLFLMDSRLRAPFALFFLGSPLVLSTAGTGHDHVAVGLAMLACFLLARDRALTSAGFSLLVLLALALGTARIIYPGFALLLALSVPAMPLRRRWLLVIVAGLGSLSIHLWGYQHFEHYQPLHLLDRGWSRVGLELMILVALLLAAAVAITGGRKDETGARSLFFVTMLLLPHLGIAVGELAASEFELAHWEGANYLFPASPALLWSCLMSGVGPARRSALP